VLLALAAGVPAGGPAARLLVELQASGAAVVIRILYKQLPSSLLALSGGAGVHAGAPAVAPAPGATLQARLVGATAGAGAAQTEFGAPVWLPGVADDESAGMLQDDTFDHLSVEEALDRILTGSLSFAAPCIPFYTPPRVEILHELAHAAHNARGLNRELSGNLTAAERVVWKDGEEYWTIAADPLGENAVAAEIGAPPRLGHGGLPLLGLVPGSADAGQTLRAQARL
jgi:hypothetical protein